MHHVAVFSKEHHEGMSGHNSISPFPPVPWWSGLGSQPAGYEQHFAHPLKSSSKGNPASENQLATMNQTDRPKEQLGILGKEKPPHFTLSPGDWGISADVKKFQLQNSSFMSASVTEQEKHVELGFRQPMICARFPYGEQYYGVVSTYASQLTGRAMLPLNSTTDEGMIFVNAKQYNGILRRRQYRAKVEQENKAKRNRKPFLHMSRHLHAMRRPRGCGGRFLNTKVMNGSNSKGKSDTKNGGGVGGGGQFGWAIGSQASDVLLSDSGNSSSPREESNGCRSNNSGSEVTSMYFNEDRCHHFLMDHHHHHHHHHHLQSVPNTMNAGHGFVLHNNWITAAAGDNTCCNLEV